MHYCDTCCFSFQSMSVWNKAVLCTNKFRSAAKYNVIQIETSTKMYTPFLNRIELTTWTICAFFIFESRYCSLVKLPKFESRYCSLVKLLKFESRYCSLVKLLKFESRYCSLIKLLKFESRYCSFFLKICWKINWYQCSLICNLLFLRDT